jgi:hypothetical protein
MCKFLTCGCVALPLLLSQEQVVELQRELDASSKKLAEVSSDRDLFLRRLQQLELEGRDGAEGGAGSSGSGSGSSALDMQRQKAHAAQVQPGVNDSRCLVASCSSPLCMTEWAVVFMCCCSACC